MTPTGQADPVLSGFPTQVETFQWHGVEINRLPRGAEILAANGACPIQALRYGRHVYGFQFHCEILDNTIGDWERIPAYRQSLLEALGREEAENLAAAVGPRLPSFRRTARRLNDNFMALFE